MKAIKTQLVSLLCHQYFSCRFQQLGAGLAFALLCLLAVNAGSLYAQEAAGSGSPPEYYLISQTDPGESGDANNKQNAEETSGESGESGEEAQEVKNEAGYLEQATKFHIGDDPTVIILIALFILAVGVTLDRVIILRKEKGDNVELADMIIKSLQEMPGQVDSLIQKISGGRYGIEGRVALKTLTGWQHGEKAMAEFAQAALTAERRKLEKRLVVLSTLGNNTPFIGLLGTVLGIMKAFKDLALMGDAGPAVVMKGISEALIATAFGLGVAIPCVISNNTLSKIVKTRLSNAEEMVRMISGFRLAKDSGKKWKEEG